MMSLKSQKSGKNNLEDATSKKEEAVDFNNDIMPEERKEVIDWLNSVKFPQKLIGGVDEVAVWKKISELDTLYAKALEAERIRYNTLLKQYRSTAVKVIKEIKEEKTEGSESDG